nr:hypothetical protein [uncultured Flavobacterium sp.]
MKPNEVVLFIYDTEENFKNKTNQLRLGNNVYKDIILIQSGEDFKKELEILQEGQKFVLICHVFHQENGEGVRHSGFLRFRGDGIEDEFDIRAIFVSSGDNADVYKSMLEGEQEHRVIYGYSDILREIKGDKITTYTKETIMQEKGITYEFGIITALYEDEFEEVKKYFTWENNKDIYLGTKRYWIGHLNGFPNRKVVAAIPNATGMVDSAIVATQMLEVFKPKFLIMSGVCGGKKGTNFGDIVLAKSILTFQKGKISSLSNADKTPITLFDKNKKPLDYNHVYDEQGNQIKISVESFEVEHDTIIEFDLQDSVQPELNRIKDQINISIKADDEIEKKFKKTALKVHFDKIACSSMVINNAGYFEESIKTVDRKIVAVEMESYGIARACKFANFGKTKWIIFKSVMDNMTNKDDEAKKFAAKTSALFLKHLVYDDILK